MSPRILLFLAVAALVAFSEGVLICGPYYDAPYNEYCYQTTGYEYTFTEAENMCNFFDMELVSIHNGKENDYVAQNAGCDQFFIGLQYAGGKYSWTDGSPVNYMNFDEPYAGNETGCAQMLNGTWVKTNCSAKLFSACKRKAFDVPETPKDACPSSEVIYSNSGILYSPGYPQSPATVLNMVCQYHIQVMPGNLVVLDYEAEMFVEAIRIYEGWSNDTENLLKILGYADTVITTKKANKMLVEFDMAVGGSWKAEFFATKPVPEPGTGITPGVSATPFPHSINCPKYAFSGKSETIMSPNFPFGYDANSDCTYYFPMIPDTMFKTEFLALNLGKDDRIDMIDLRTYAVFKSTGDSDVHEGFTITVTFPFAIRFRSGEEYGMFNHWRICVELSEALEISL